MSWVLAAVALALVEVPLLDDDEVLLPVGDMQFSLRFL
jgi:hypothetical protein